MSPKPSKVPIFFGGLLILLGICFNEYFLNLIFFYDDPLVGSSLTTNRILIAVLMISGIIILANRKKSFFVGMSKNLLLLFSTIAIVYLVFELMFSVFMGNFSVGLARFIPFPYRIINQSSKNAKIPENHIAIFGDSHAVGAGDWYLDTDPMTRDPYHSAHILHRELGEDVLSFGMSGASSLTSMIAVPINNYRLLHKKYDLPHPKKIVVYFYAGNDITDNLTDLNLREPSYVDFTQSNELDYNRFSDYIEHVVIAPKPFEDVAGKFIGLRFIKTMVTNTFSPQFAELDKIERDSTGVYQQNVQNQIVRRNKLLNLPQKLQSPALELNQDEWEKGLKIFAFSLKYMQSYFKNAEIYVVYLPSVLASYEFKGDVSAQVIEERHDIYSVEALEMRSDSLQAHIRAACDELSINFIDTRDVLRKKGEDIFVHGPKDWKHPNKEGYELIAQEIASAIKR